MLLVCHAGVFPVVEYLTGKVGAFTAGLVALLVDGTIVHRAYLYPKVLKVEGLAFDAKTTATALIL